MRTLRTFFVIGVVVFGVHGTVAAQELVCACQPTASHPPPLKKMRIVEGQGNCQANEFEICWNRQGPQGPDGSAATTVGQVVRVDIDATSSFDKQWFVPTGKVFLVSHIAWDDQWITSGNPMEVAIRHFQSMSGSAVTTKITSTSGVHSFQPPLVLPASTGFEAPGLGDPLRSVYVYGRLVEADSALLSSTE